MTNEELLEALIKRFDSIESRLDSVEEKLDGLIEDHQITREGVNTLLGWADDVACVVKVPLKPAQ